MCGKWLKVAVLISGWFLISSPLAIMAATDEINVDLEISSTTTPPVPPPAIPGTGAPLPHPFFISQVTVLQLSFAEVTLSWQTNRPASSQIEYGRTVNYELGRRVVSENFVTHHQITISGLESNTFYHVRISAQDQIGQQAVTDDYMFLTALPPDLTPPPNVLNLHIISGDQQLILNWQNPVTEDLSGVLVVRRTDRLPLHPTDGQAIISGLMQQWTDKNLVNGQRYYYALFTFDQAQNFSSGALISGVPLKPAVSPVKPGPLPPPFFELPPVTPGERLPISVSQLVTNNNTLILEPDDNEQITIINQYPFNLVVPMTAVKKKVSQVIVTVVPGEQWWWAAPNVEQKSYLANLSLLLAPGDYQLRTLIQYQDKTQDSIITNIKIVSPGQVLDKFNNQPIDRAVVILWQYINGDWKLWNVSSGEVRNPQITKTDGNFSFMVSNGRYRLEILRAGYKPWQSEIEITDMTVNNQVWLEKESVKITPMVINIINHYWYLVLALLLLIIGLQIRQILVRRR